MEMSCPELDTCQKRAKIPSQELSDYLVKKLDKRKIKEENRKTLPIFSFLLLKISKYFIYIMV